jgi:hypothetical protein
MCALKEVMKGEDAAMTRTVESMCMLTPGTVKCFTIEYIITTVA